MKASHRRNDGRQDRGRRVHSRGRGGNDLECKEAEKFLGKVMGKKGGKYECDEAITRGVNAASEKWREMMKLTPYRDRER